MRRFLFMAAAAGSLVLGLANGVDGHDVVALIRLIAHAS